MLKPTMKIALQPWIEGFRPWEILWVCLAYIICARIGQHFAISPGNVTPVWIPSGVMLTLALKFGVRIWPGVFLGAFIGNIWVYIDFNSWLGVLSATASATLNGIGDVLSTVLAAQLIISLAGSNRILLNHKTFFAFILLGVILGPLTSAIFGVGGLLLFGHIDSGSSFNIFLTWWVGDGSGVIVFAPFLLSWLYEERFFDRKTIILMSISIPYSLIVTAIAIDLLSISLIVKYAVFAMTPLFLVILFSHGQRFIFSIQTTILSLFVVATSNGYGPFATDSQFTSLMQLQIFTAIFSCVLFVIALFNLERTRNEDRLEKRTQELEELYRKDPLTNLWNRYRIKEFLGMELKRFQRENRPFGILMLDIDDFKLINDQHGHLIGDDVLVQLAKLIQQHTRNIDLLGRWGGEEYLMVVSDCSGKALQTLSGKLNQLVEEHNFVNNLSLTISIGITLVKEGDSELTLLDRADAALYNAKLSGKNQTALA